MALPLLLAGCAALEEPTSTEPSLLGLCPQWLPAPGHDTEVASLTPRNGSNAMAALRFDAPAGLSYQNRPLDRVTVKVRNLTLSQGSVAMRAYADSNGTRGEQLPILNLRGETPTYVPVLGFASAADTDREAVVLLSGVTQGSVPRPGPLWITLSNEGSGNVQVEIEASFAYRVCGA